MTPLEQALARSTHLSAVGRQVFTVWFLTGVDDVARGRDTESRYLELSRSASPAAAEAGYLVGLVSTRRENILGTLPLPRQPKLPVRTTEKRGGISKCCSH
ncbi:hypothetical protein OHA27_37380 [Streptomyces sp. NBC_01619]|uniref:hypothetical protein n=1 Tax=Streptomyces sp. NBC_01619 TaxID=2975901 RepID=UPI0022556642|nr:hypothetical protein [Streptomyces sp. NBC_01619]MCX4515819.1 hypothetical protein [Streptomyces sp. NBC_01619]